MNTTHPTNRLNALLYRRLLPIAAAWLVSGMMLAFAAGSIGDTVFCDSNNSRAQDPGEPGIPNVTVKLFSCSFSPAPPIDFETPVVTAAVNVGSTYSAGGFTLQCPGSMFLVHQASDCGGGCAVNGSQTLVSLNTNSPAPGGPITVITAPPGTLFTLVVLDAAEGIVSSPSFPHATSLTITGTLPAGGGTVSETFAFDGVIDGDGGSPDFQTFALSAAFTSQAFESVQISAAGPALGGDGAFSLDNIILTTLTKSPVDSKVTDTDGHYLFENLVAGCYYVEVDLSNLPPGAVAGQCPTALRVNLAADQSVLDADFCLACVQPAAIGDDVFCDADGNGTRDSGEAGIPDVVVRLIECGSSTLTPIDFETPVVTGPLNLGSTYNAGGFTLQCPGSMFLVHQTGDCGGGCAGNGTQTLVSLNTNSPAPGGPITVITAPPGTLFTLVALDAAEGIVSWPEFPHATSLTITGTLPAGGGTVSETFAFDGVIDGDGGSPDFQTFALSAAFTSQAFESVQISVAGPALGGDGAFSLDNLILVTRTAPSVIATQTTDASGHYRFDGLLPGCYQVEVDITTLPADVSAGQCPTGWSVSLAEGQEALDADFCFACPQTTPSAALGDRVWVDTNGNGQQDDGEPGLNGVEVSLYGCDNTLVAITTTATSASGQDGAYLFSGLPAGCYQVEFALPDGYLRTTKDIGSDITDSDADPATGRTGSYTLAAGETNLTVDTGVFRPSTVGNCVWVDLNGNGVQDESSAAGLNGVTVRLLDCAGAQIVSVVTADGPGGKPGYYRFDNLQPGCYRVQFEAPAGYHFTVPNAAGNPANDSDADPATGLTADINLVENQEDLRWDAGLVSEQEPCVPGTFTFSGRNSLYGSPGNIRTFSAGTVKVKASAFSRKGRGDWATAYLGIFSKGLGVTDRSEGDGRSNRYLVDNIGQVNYVLFEFSEPVVVERVQLNTVVGDSDLSVWIGTKNDPFNNHLTLSDSFLGGLGYSEVSMTDSSSPRTADLNATQLKGNVLVIAAWAGDTTPDDQFLISVLDFCRSGSADSQLPQPWETRDIGGVGVAGSASASDGVFTVVGSGADIWNTSDEFRYVYQPAKGDCQIIARVASVEATDPWAKAGIMIRETLEPGSKHASVFVTPANGVAFQYRDSTGGTSGNVNKTGLAAPYWVKLIRTGTYFLAFRSPDGVQWAFLGSRSISMSSSVYIGLAVTSHNDGVACTSVISNVGVQP